MRIGIDIDGVLTDEKRFIIDNGTKFFCENNIPYIIHDDKYDCKDIFDVTEEQYKLFKDKYLFDYSLNTLIRPYAAEVIKKLKEEHEIFIITARDFTTYENDYQIKMQDIVRKWLSDNNVMYDEIIFSDNKDIICEKKEIDVMIEDKPENVLLISKKIPVLCYDHPYNKKIYNKNIHRCYSWYDIYDKICKLMVVK